MADNIEKTLIKGFEQTKPVHTGLEKLVFGNATEETYSTEKIEADIYDGKSGVAGYTARGAKGQTVGLEGWTTVEIAPPLIDESFNITTKDLEVREMGKSNVNNGDRQSAKFQQRVNKQIKRLKDRRQKAYNQQVAELITTGKVTIIEQDDKGNKKGERVQNFNMPTANIQKVATSWSDSAYKGIVEDVIKLTEAVEESSGLVPEYAVVGKNTIKDMLNNKALADLFNNRRITLGNLTKEDKGNGLTYWGDLLGLNIYTVSEKKEDGTPLIPDDVFAVGSSQAETDIAFGSVDTIVNGQPKRVETKISIKKIVDEEAVAVKTTVKNAKLYCLTQAGAFGCLTTKK